MKASSQWLTAAGSEFATDRGRAGCAHLKHYSVDYREWGSGPPLVLVPGLAGGFGLLRPLARCLGEHFRVISYQLRGEDDCFALRRSFGLADLVADLAEFIEWHCLERPNVFGVSFGGAVALEFAARFPHRVRNLVVQGIGARFDPGLFQRIAGSVLSDYPLPADNPFFNQFFNLLFGDRQEPGPLFEFVTRQCWQTDQSVMAHRFRMVERFDLTGRLGRIQSPTLVLAGERDVVVSQRSLRELSRNLPRARSVRVPEAGHLAAVTHPYRLAAEVRKFAAREVAGQAEPR